MAEKLKPAVLSVNKGNGDKIERIKQNIGVMEWWNDRLTEGLIGGMTPR